MTLAEIAAVVDGRVCDDTGVVVTGPAFVDSRAVEPGGLFVAVAGERVDGHDFASAAVAGGAAGVLGTRATGVPTVLVEDPVLALGRLARHVVDRLVADGLVVLALTGSAGKTGTKDYLAHLLGVSGRCVATAGNLNNELGVPLTALRADPATDHLVVEMGARGVGHISYLCSVAPPSVAAVLNVGTAHLGEFGGPDAVAQAKGEIVESLPTDGTAVLNVDDPRVTEMRSRTGARVIGVGHGDHADFRLGPVELDDLGRPAADLYWPDGTARLALGQPGEHQLGNAAVAVAMAVATGMDAATAVAALADAPTGSRWRMELDTRADGALVLNDSYNANPESVRAALDTLAVLGQRNQRRTIAVLGEMRELGDTAAQAHRAVGRHAAELGVDVLVVLGTPGEWYLEGALAAGWQGEVFVTASRDEIVAWVRENVGARDAVLVKASRGVALEAVAEAALAVTATEESR
ncbi:UDP-N-acetylmuramoyl-tripeptide--D-alanyl-D-alanine ligase [Nocardioides limicola]|uniref:UDP-N-acetylmuramoyl-tripeptide--D-alanyl-D- alanine ligase n=1 Tax=Nocardioides limicola TaxID=2803368 RepID=UPI001EEF9EB7|nr:UDP-N-acetylmuramoyl-tripeptide--D-alanyl-D-alanine ligase [Nocardioides sp. DJM-14]